MARSDVARSAVQRAIAWTNVNDMRIIAAHALVAQLDRVLPSEGRGRGFESRRVRHIFKCYRLLLQLP